MIETHPERRKTPERHLSTSEQMEEEGQLDSATGSVWSSDCGVIYKVSSMADESFVSGRHGCSRLQIKPSIIQHKA